MSSYISSYARVDPRIRKVLGEEIAPALADVSSREELLAEIAAGANRPLEDMLSMMDSLGTEEIAPSTGLSVRTEHIVSHPDNNKIKILLIRPDTSDKLPCVYYIHGGAMQMASCYNGSYRAWGRMIAAHGVAVAMVDFRNCLLPSSAPEVAPFPAGLNDCVSGLQWIHANSAALAIDPERIIVAGESGGGNLALASGMKLKREGRLSLVQGFYVVCPFIAGQWPSPDSPSSTEYNGIGANWHSNRYAMAYGIEAFRERNPLAWPAFAQEEDVRGFPPVVISVNECDALRDEGINFYRLLLKSGVPARCRQIMGATHGIEVFPLGTCPELSRDTAAHIAAFCKRP